MIFPIAFFLLTASTSQASIVDVSTESSPTFGAKGSEIPPLEPHLESRDISQISDAPQNISNESEVESSFPSENVDEPSFEPASNDVPMEISAPIVSENIENFSPENPISNLPLTHDEVVAPTFNFLKTPRSSDVSTSEQENVPSEENLVSEFSNHPSQTTDEISSPSNHFQEKEEVASSLEPLQTAQMFFSEEAPQASKEPGRIGKNSEVNGIVLEVFSNLALFAALSLTQIKEKIKTWGGSFFSSLKTSDNENKKNSSNSNLHAVKEPATSSKLTSFSETGWSAAKNMLLAFGIVLVFKKMYHYFFSTPSKKNH